MSALRPLVLVGAGGFARETAELVRSINAATPSYELLGFVDDDPALAGRSRAGCPVLGPLESIHDLGDAAVVVCIGSPAATAIRRHIVDLLDLDAERFATLVHPRAELAASVFVGGGSVIHAGCIATTEITIGRHVEMMPATVLTHDDVVDDFATFGAGVRLAGGVRIGHDAYIGSGACVREGIEVGGGSTIGMGSVVIDHVPPGEVWAGNPARFLRSAGPLRGVIAVAS